MSAGNGRTIFVGPLSSTTLEAHGLDVDDDSWFLVDFDGPKGTRVMAKIIDRDMADDLLQMYLMGVRHSSISPR